MRRSHLFLAAFLPMALLGSCAEKAAPTVDFDVVGQEADPFDNGARLNSAAQLVRGATAEGLVTLDEQGRVIPAVADRWIVTDDGLSYIFRLRDGLWRDGTPLTGETARAALLRAIRELQGTGLGRDLDGVDEVRAMAGRVLEIRLTHPVPDLLQLLAQPEFGLRRNGQGDGPMDLKREGNLALLTPIPPANLGLPQPQDWQKTVRSIRLRALPAAVAVRRFSGGDVDLVLGGRFESYVTALTAAGLSRRFLKVDPVTGLFGLVVVRPQGVLANAELRAALSKAIDRDALASALTIDGFSTAYALPGTGEAPAGPRWTRLSADRGRQEAGALVARWVARYGGSAPLTVALPEGPGADALFARLVADFQVLGVSLQRVGNGAAADLQLLDLVARYPSPGWYLNQLSCAAKRGLCDAGADDLAATARAVPDPARRAELQQQALVQLDKAQVFIPLGNPVRWSLVRDTVQGFAPNQAGIHPLKPMAVRGD